MTKEAKKKADFRKTSKWKNFRNYLKKERKIDEITLKPLRPGFVVHHMVTLGSRCESDPVTYEDISDERKFRCYSRTTHKLIHYLLPYFLKDDTIIDRLAADLRIMKKLHKERI